MSEKQIWTGIKGIEYLGDGKIAHNGKVAEIKNVADELWDCFLQGWNEACEIDPDREFHKYLVEYAEEVCWVVDN